jgi:hypothetical protein
MKLYIALAFGSVHALSCTSDTGASESDVRQGSSDEATLCELMRGKTTFNEAKELLRQACRSERRDER